MKMILFCLIKTFCVIDNMLFNRFVSKLKLPKNGILCFLKKSAYEIYVEDTLRYWHCFNLIRFFTNVKSRKNFDFNSLPIL